MSEHVRQLRRGSSCQTRTLGTISGFLFVCACAAPVQPPVHDAVRSEVADSQGTVVPSAAPKAAVAESERSPPVAQEGRPGERFFAALSALSRGEGRRCVRITWLGDSHTAADFWTGETRRLLQAEYGDGGPGFVPVALSGTRHDGVTVQIVGDWKQEPQVAAGRQQQLDGRFGLAGRRAVAMSGDAATVRLQAADADRIWSVHYRGDSSDSVAVDGDEAAETRTTIEHDPQGRTSDWYVSTATTSASTVTLGVQHGRVQLLGLFVESVRPGLVLDSLGINGARLATLLAWDEGEFAAHLQARQPDLVVLAYGTNEAGDQTAVEQYSTGYERVVREIQNAGASCLLIGPTDRQDKRGRTLSRVEVLDAFLSNSAARWGCLYFSAYQAMGGQGGYAAWKRASPRLAGKDGVHLTVAGYHVLATSVVTLLNKAY